MFVRIAHPFLADLHDPTDEPTLNPLVDEHQNQGHTVEEWKSKCNTFYSPMSNLYRNLV